MAFASQAQSDSTIRKGLFRLNIDLLSPVYGYFSDVPKQRMGGEAMLEFSKNDTLFFLAEVGYHRMDLTKTFFQTVSSGEFLRLGVNRSLMKYNSKRDYDILYVGARVSGSVYNLQYPSFVEASPYWGSTSISVPSANYVALWTEGVLGARIETFKNLFLGFDVRGSLLIYDFNRTDYKTLFVPGFGNPQNGVSLWASYSIGYKF